MARVPTLEEDVADLRRKSYIIDGKTEAEKREQGILAVMELIAEDAAARRQATDAEQAGFERFAAETLAQPR